MRNITIGRAFWCSPLLAAALALPVGAEQAVSVPPGTAVPLQFQEDVSTKTAKKGSQIKLRVYTNVMVDGKTVIKQDAEATGIVERVRQPGIFGRRAQLRIRLESVDDVAGNRVPLEPYTSGERYDARGPGAAGAGLLVLGPVGLVGGAFIKGGHVTIDKGSRIVAIVWDGQTKTDRGNGGAGNDRSNPNNLPPVEWP